MSAEINFGYSYDEYSGNVPNARGETRDVWPQTTEARVLYNLRSIRLTELGGFAPEVDELIEQKWEWLSFLVRATTYTSDATESYIKDHRDEHFDDYRESYPTKLTDEDLIADLETRARGDLYYDVGAPSHLVLAKPWYAQIQEHLDLANKIKAQGQYVSRLAEYDGPFLTATLDDLVKGDSRKIHFERKDDGYPATTLLEHPGKSGHYTNIKATDLLPEATWVTITNLRDKLYNAAVAFLGKKVTEEADELK